MGGELERVAVAGPRRIGEGAVAINILAPADAHATGRMRNYRSWKGLCKIWPIVKPRAIRAFSGKALRKISKKSGIGVIVLTRIEIYDRII